MAVWANKQSGIFTADDDEHTAAISLGAAAADRFGVATVYWRRATPTTLDQIKVTNIDGAGATGEVAGAVVRQRNFDSGGGGGSMNGVSIWAFHIPAGANANLFIKTAAVVLRGGWSFAMTNGIGPTEVNHPDLTAESTNADLLSATVDAVEDGVIVAIAANGNVSDGAWTGLTQDVDQDVEAISWYGVAYHDVVADETDRAISCDLTGTLADQVMVVASFVPSMGAGAPQQRSRGMSGGMGGMTGGMQTKTRRGPALVVPQRKLIVPGWRAPVRPHLCMEMR